MESKYARLRQQLNELGYTDSFPPECTSLIEHLVADLVQTTKSLQQYMGLAKEAVQQRDELKCATEPYKCDNAKLIKQNNQLNLQLMQAKDECLNISQNCKAKIDKLEKQLECATREISTLKDKCRSMSIKSICSETISSRSKSLPIHERMCSASRTNMTNNNKRSSDCLNCDNLLRDIDQLTTELTDCKEVNILSSQDIIYLKSQMALRDKEIARLNKLVEYGRPSLPSDGQTCHSDLMKKVIGLEKDIDILNERNDELEYQLKESIAKQHEAMTKAIRLADKNSLLEKEMHEFDELTLKLESECNKKLKEKNDYIAALTARLNPTSSRARNDFSQEDFFDKIESYASELSVVRASLEENNKIKERLIDENKKLLDANRQLELLASNLADSEAIAQLKLKKIIDHSTDKSNNNVCNCKMTKEQILSIIKTERKEYEKQIEEIKQHLNSSTKLQSLYTKELNDDEIVEKLKEERDFYQRELSKLKNKVPSDIFLNELQHKIYELEQNIHFLKKQNESLAETNRTLTVHLDESSQQQRSHRSETLQSSLNKLQIDLERARSDIKNLEQERSSLRDRLKAATENNMSEVNSLVSRNIRYESLLNENRSLNSSRIENLQHECEILKDKLKLAETDLIHSKSLHTQMKNLQSENEKQLANFQNLVYEAKKEIRDLKETLSNVEKAKLDLEYEIKLLKSDKINLKENVSRLDQDRDKYIIDLEEKNNKITQLQQQLRAKETNSEMLENRITELIRKQELSTNENINMEHSVRDLQVQNEALNKEISLITKEKDGALIENRRLQSDLAVISADLQSMTRDYENSQKEVDEMKQQLQHYVDEVRRIEDLLSKKEAERTEMLDHFASLSHEATVLESNNHSLESEAASKAAQLQSTIEKMSELEIKLRSKDTIAEMQEEKITTLVYKISKLESELEHVRDENKSLEHNLACAREMCIALETQKKNILAGKSDIDIEKKKFESTIDFLQDEKSKLQEDVNRLKVTVESLESLLGSSRREALDLKLLLEDAIKESKDAKEKAEHLRTRLEILQDEGHSSRLHKERVAKELQELHWQMNDGRLQRQSSSRSQPSGTL